MIEVRAMAVSVTEERVMDCKRREGDFWGVGCYKSSVSASGWWLPGVDTHDKS